MCRSHGKYIRVMAGLCVLWGLSTSVYAMKIGYADMELALSSVEAGKKAKQQIEQEVAKRRKNLEKSRSEVLKLEEDYKKQELVLSEKSKEKKRLEYLKKVDELRGLVASSQQEMEGVEERVAAPILEKMRQELHKLSKKRGYDMVVAKGVLLYSNDEKNDLTQELIREFNKEYKGR